MTTNPLTTATQAEDGAATSDLASLQRDISNYLAWSETLAQAKERADKIKARILDAVQKFGYVPTNAEKSRRIDTARFIATVTTGTTVEINDANCTELELLLAHARRPKLFSLLFERRVEYSLAQTAAETIKGTRWPRKHADRIRTLYALCFSPKPKTPALSIESRQAFEERERKAAAKAAKKSAKAAKAGA